MGSGKTSRTRKLRHQSKQVIKFGWSAKAKHKSKSGRTGGVFHKQLKSRRCDK